VRIDLPTCGFKLCRNEFDGNCHAGDAARKNCGFLISEKASGLCAEALADFTGSCPLDTHDFDMGCDKNCDGREEYCWKRYFEIRATEGEGERENEQKQD
jgi:hypothetical protein